MRTAHLRRLYVFQWPPDVGEEGGPQVNMFEQVFGDMSQVQGVGPGMGGVSSHVMSLAGGWGPCPERSRLHRGGGGLEWPCPVRSHVLIAGA